MIETLHSFLTNVQNNQLILLLFSGGVIWTILSNIRSICETIWDGILSIISFTVNSVNVGDYDIPLLNYKITKVLSESKVIWERHTELQPSTSDYNEAHLQNAAFGRSYRWMWGHLVILDRTYSTQSTKVVTTISARVFFANRKKFIKRLISEIEKCSLTGARDTITIGMGRGIMTEKPKRSIESVYSNNRLSEKILADVRSFLNNRDLYIKGNSPYKFVALLTGAPGTGKTSLIHAVASELGMGVRFLNTDDEDFEDIARVMTRNDEYSGSTGRSIIVIEDVDCMAMSATSKRELPKELTDTQKEELEAFKIDDGDDEVLINAKMDAMKAMMNGDAHTSISLTSILNLLDGIITPSGSIVFLTSNNPDKLDDALLRDGRIDARYEFSNFNKETSNKLIKDYLGFEIDNIKGDITPSSIQRDVMKVKIGRMTKEELVEKFSNK